MRLCTGARQRGQMRWQTTAVWRLNCSDGPVRSESTRSLTSDFLRNYQKPLPSQSSQLPEHKSLHIENKTTGVTSALDKSLRNRGKDYFRELGTMRKLKQPTSDTALAAQMRRARMLVQRPSIPCAGGMRKL